MELKYILKVFIIVFLILSLIIFVNTIGLNLNEETTSKKLIQVVTIEGLEIPLTTESSKAFCEVHKGSSGSLNESCGSLTRNNCTSTSCCVWTSDKKCLAGGKDGPTFDTGVNDKTKKDDKYYYFHSTCYGNGCQKQS